MTSPSARPLAAAEAASEGLPPELTTVPWIDVHNHAHTLSWSDRERYALTGCHAMVMMAAGYHWTPYRPVEASDVRYLWDEALARRGPIADSHAFDPRLAVGIFTGARVEGYDELLSVLPEYCEREEVVAVGETGVTASQHGARWPLEGQRDVLRRQFAAADDHDLPVVLHTPTDADVDGPSRVRGAMPGYEQARSLATDPVLGPDDVKRAAIEIDLELAHDAGLPQDRVVLSHATPSVVPFVLEETDCYLSFTISYPWMHGVGPRDVAAVVGEHGPERILVETDSANVLRADVADVKRTVFEMYRAGVDLDAIRQVVYENPRELFGLS